MQTFSPHFVFPPAFIVPYPLFYNKYCEWFTARLSLQEGREVTIAHTKSKPSPLDTNLQDLTRDQRICGTMESGSAAVHESLKCERRLGKDFSVWVTTPSQQRGGLAGTSQRRWGFAPQLFALQTDRLRRHQGRGREVVGGGLLLMSTVDVTGDEQGDLSYLLMQQRVDERLAHEENPVCGPYPLMTVLQYLDICSVTNWVLWHDSVEKGPFCGFLYLITPKMEPCTHFWKLLRVYH